MNSGILNKVILQNLRHSQCRYLSVQQNINKCSSTCQTVDFRRSKENHSSRFIFTKFTNNRTLCQSTLPVHIYFRRNLSVTSQLYVKNLDPLKDIDVSLPKVDVTSPPTVDITPAAEITESASTSIFSCDSIINYVVEYFQGMLCLMHEGSELPWWATIALTTFAIRTSILLPFAVTQLQVVNRLEKVNLDLVDIDKKLKRESVIAQRKLGYPQYLANQKYKEAKDGAYWNLITKENCHPMKTYLLVSMQMGTWIHMTSAVYTLSNPDFVGSKIVSEMTTGGFGWITDLTQTDPYFILPVTIGLVNLLLVEIHQSFKVIRRSKSEQYQRAFFRLVSIAYIPLAVCAPASLNIYWLSSSLYGIIQAFVLNSAPVRRIFNVPNNHPELKQPYRYFLKTTKERLKLGKGETAIVPK